MNVHMLRFFALEENYPRCAAGVQGWKDGFPFPSALTKMRVKYQERWINVACSSVWPSMIGGLVSMAPIKGTGGEWSTISSIMSSPCCRSWLTMLLPSRGHLIGWPPATWL